MILTSLRRVFAFASAFFFAPLSILHAQTITYIGVIYDQTNFETLNLGDAGYWFPQFDASSPVEGRWTGENPRNGLPAWAGPLNHVTADPLDPLDPINNNPLTFPTRTFSQDGPSRSKGGQPTWNIFKLPNGETGRSGAIVDPFTAGNSNNTINRIQLNNVVPSTFYFSVITDNTNLEHDPTGQLRARGEVGETFPGLADGIQIESVGLPETNGGLIFNGIADVYTFRYDGFVAGDYIKLRLSGDANEGGASFAGLLFDVVYDPHLIPEPTSDSIALFAGVCVAISLQRRKSLSEFFGS